MNYYPLFDNVLIEPVTEDSTIVYATDQGEPIRGKVVDTGGGWKSKMRVSLDDIIWFEPFKAKKVVLQNKDYYILDQHAVLLVEDTNG